MRLVPARDMNDELAQLVVLTSYGNAYLTDTKSPCPPEFLGSNSAFAHVRSVHFADEHNRTLANDPAQWFSYLRSADARRLWLVNIGARVDAPAHIAESFSGGILRGIQVDYQGVEEVWTPRWKFGRGQRWNVRYTRAPLGRSLVTSAPSLESGEQALRTGIEEARRLAEDTGHHYWLELFSDALEIFQSLDDLGPSDLLPQRGYGLRARRVLEVARRAFVFGGMGSWNDLWFADNRLQTRYEAVTALLYGAVIAGIIEATNSFGEAASSR